MIHRKLHAWPLIVVLAVLTAVLGACGSGTATAPAVSSGLATLQLDIKGKPFTLEIADTEAAREHGLMDRNTMANDHGMIFIFEQADRYNFWMKNTLIDLDIIWLDPEGKVVYKLTMKAGDLIGGGNTIPAKYVIELNSGMATTLGLKLDDKISLPEKVLKPTSRPADK